MAGKRAKGTSGTKGTGVSGRKFGPTELAVHLGVTEAAVRNAVTTGRIRADADGKFDVETATRDWAANRRGIPGPGRPRRPTAAPPDASAHPSKPRPRPTTLIEAQTEHEILKLEERQLRIDRMRGDLVNRHLAESRVRDLAVSTRDSWRTWPLDAAEQIAAELGVDDVAKVRRVLEAQVAARLGALREIVVRLE